MDRRALPSYGAREKGQQDQESEGWEVPRHRQLPGVSCRREESVGPSWAERVGRNGSSGRPIAWEQLFGALGEKKKKKWEWAGLCSSVFETSGCLCAHRNNPKRRGPKPVTAASA